MCGAAAGFSRRGRAPGGAPRPPGTSRVRLVKVAGAGGAAPPALTLAPAGAQIGGLRGVPPRWGWRGRAAAARRNAVGRPPPCRPHRQREAAAAARHQLRCAPRLRVTTPPLPRPPAAEAAALLAQWGKNELEEKRTPKWLVYLKHREWIAPPSGGSASKRLPCHWLRPLPPAPGCYLGAPAARGPHRRPRACTRDHPGNRARITNMGIIAC